MTRFAPLVVSAICLVALAGPARADANSDLLMAAYRGDRVTARALINRGASLAARDENGYTPLHWAAYNGDVRMLELLLEAGAPVDPLDAKGTTPLMLAAWNGYAQCVHTLLAHGANRELRSTDGFIALDYARSRHHTAVMRELVAIAVVRHPGPVRPLPRPMPRPQIRPLPIARATPRPHVVATPAPEPVVILTPEPTPEPAGEPTPEPTRTPEDETAVATPPPASPGPPGNMLSLVAGVHLSKINFPIVGVHYRRTLIEPVALQLGYELGGYTQPIGAGTVDYDFTRLHAALVTTGWLYGGVGITHVILGTLYSGGYNPSATSYEVIGGLRLPIGIFNLNLEGRFGYDGPSTATLGAGAGF